MKQLYKLCSITKQTHWEWRKQQAIYQDKWLMLEPILQEWRERHPCMSLKKLYVQIAPNFIGRDGFIDYAMVNGFEAVLYKKRPKRPLTTILNKKQNYPNLLIELEIIDIDRVWVSDTTYFKIKEKWHYITFIMDLYSRYILGYHAAENLLVNANLACLKMALNTKKKQNIMSFKNQLIHHSDRGSQYKSIVYTDVLKKAGIKISMGKIVYDNIMIERFNQTIKGEYLIHRNIQSLNDLRKHLKKDIYLYNYERPHLALSMKTPSDFERYLCNIPLCQRTKLKVFALNTKMYKNKNSNNNDPKQLNLSL